MKKTIIYLLLLFAAGINSQDTTAIVPVAISEQDSLSNDSLGTDSITTFLKTDNVEVIKAFEANLAESVMLSINPTLPVIIPIEKKYRYNVTIVPYNIIYPDPVIRPVAMPADKQEKYKKAFIQLGYGNIKNAFIDINLNHSFSDLIDWNLAIDHQSADNGSKNSFQNHEITKVRTGIGLSVMETSKVELELFGGLEKRNLYYDEPDRPIDLLNVVGTRDITQLGAKFRFFNAAENNAGVDYNFTLGAKYTDVSDLNQDEINLSGHLAFTRQVKNNIDFTFSGGGDLNNNYNTNDVIGIFDPSLNISGNKLGIKAGLSYIYVDEASYPYPEVEIKYSFDAQALQGFVGVDQNYTRNNIANTVSLNPFTNNIQGRQTSIIREIYGGVKGNILGLKYSAKGGYKDIANQAYFNTDFSDSLRRMHLRTTDLTAIFISGTVEAPITSTIKIGGSVTQNFYDEVDIEELWHTPNLEFNTFANIKLLNDKINIKPNLYLSDGVEAITPSGTETLEDLIDLNVDIEILPVENIGVYLRGKNLLDKGYRRWYGYSNYGIHFEGGVIAKF